MRYGLVKKLTTWRFWITNISTQLVVGIVVDFIFKVVWGVESYSPGKFCWFWFLRVLGYTLGNFLAYRLFKKDWLFDDDTDFDEVELQVKKNRSLWEKIEAIENTHSWDYPTDYPPRRAILANYAKSRKLKDYEKDFVRFVLKYNDGVLKKVKDGTW